MKARMMGLALGCFLAGAAHAEELRIALTFAGGHELARGDFGRPINLMAAALSVTPAQFRQAFSGVTPARGRPPTGDEARRNKEALMSVLAPLGVTNERMDEVANYYRFRPDRGESWPARPAQGYALVDGDAVKQLVVTDPGAGYNTPPRVVLDGLPGLALEAQLAYDRDLIRNGGVTAVIVAPRR